MTDQHTDWQTEEQTENPTNLQAGLGDVGDELQGLGTVENDLLARGQDAALQHLGELEQRVPQQLQVSQRRDALAVKFGADASEGARQQVLDERVGADAEVDEGGGGGDGGAEARLGQPGGQVEPEVLVAQRASAAEEDHAGVWKVNTHHRWGFWKAEVRCWSPGPENRCSRPCEWVLTLSLPCLPRRHSVNDQ